MSQIQLTKEMGLEIATNHVVIRLKPLKKWNDNMEHETRIIVRGPTVTGRAIIASPTPKQLGRNMMQEAISNAINKLEKLLEQVNKGEIQ